MLAAESAVKGLDLPVATQGTEQWAGLVAQAMVNRPGHETPEKTLQGFASFKSRAMADLQAQVSADQKLFEVPNTSKIVKSNCCLRAANYRAHSWVMNLIK